MSTPQTDTDDTGTVHHSQPDEFPEVPTLQIRPLHYADANEAEIKANEAILTRFEEMFTGGTFQDLERYTEVFLDAIVEGRKLQRRDERGQLPNVTDLDFSIRQLLTHIPIQEWPFPHRCYCPCPFCDAHGEWDALELHLNDAHPTIAQTEGYHSEIQLTLTGLLGMEMRVTKGKRWKCPFGYCSTQFDNYKEVAEHVLHSNTHKDYEQYLYDKIGGFWAPIICYLNMKNKWPSVHDIFYKDEAKAEIELIQLDKTAADQMWKMDGGVSIENHPQPIHHRWRGVSIKHPYRSNDFQRWISEKGLTYLRSHSISHV
jgi:hypothetical protein